MARIVDGTPCLTSNSTAAGFATIVATTTAPATTTSGVHDLLDYNGGNGPENKPTIEFGLFGAGAANQTGLMRVYGWRRVAHATLPIWVPKLLWSGTGTFSTLTGVAATVPVNTDLLADTLAAAAEDPGLGLIQQEGGTPANVFMATVLLAVDGFRFIQFDPKKGSGTNVNGVFWAY